MNELPVKATWPVETLKLKTAQSSESWLATISHWPLRSNWKWRGLRGTGEACGVSSRGEGRRLGAGGALGRRRGWRGGAGGARFAAGVEDARQREQARRRAVRAPRGPKE